MSGHSHHPGTDDLADFLAGQMRGLRGKRVAAHVAQCRACASVSDRIGAVSPELAAAPPLTIPRQVDRRIMAAILTEAATRDAEAQRAGSAVPVRRRTRPARLFSRRVPVFSLTVPLGALVPAVMCLLLAVAGYLLALPAAPGSHRASAAPGAAGSGAQHDVPGAGRGSAAVFFVTVSHTDFRATTLQTQVQQQLQARTSAPVVPARSGTGAQSVVPQDGAAHQGSASASPSARTGTAHLTPPGSLVGCVMHLTRDQEPAMVDRASYQSRPAYIIAVADHAWVVPLNCTAAHLSVIRSVALSPGA